MVCFIFIGFLIGCRLPYRVFDDKDLEEIAAADYGFNEFTVFKIVDSDTSEELTGRKYNNSGVIIGKKSGDYRMIFVPKMIAEEPFLIDNPFSFNLEEIYEDLAGLEGDNGKLIDMMFISDYGGLSIAIYPFTSVQENNEDLIFDSPIFFIVTTDTAAFYIGHIGGKHYIFNDSYELIFNQD